MKRTIIAMVISLYLVSANAQVIVKEQETGKEFTINYTNPPFASSYTTWGFAPLLNFEFITGNNYSDLVSMFMLTGFIEKRFSNKLVLGASPKVNLLTLIRANQQLNKKLGLGLDLYANLPLASSNKISYRTARVSEYVSATTRRLYKIRHTPTNLTTTAGVSAGYEYFYVPVLFSSFTAPVAYGYSALKGGIYVERDWWLDIPQSVTRHRISRFYLNALYAPAVKYKYVIDTGHFEYINTDSIAHNKAGFEAGFAFIPVSQTPGLSINFSFGQHPGQNFEMLNLKTYFLRFQFFITFSTKGPKGFAKGQE